MDLIEPPNIYLSEFLVDFGFSDCADIISIITLEGIFYDF